jgi:dolichyl-phosphate beta-glucosyltransferase
VTRDFVWVVPCHDEETRLDTDAFVRLVDARLDIDVLFVDDGSEDGTGTVLEGLAQKRPGRLQVLSLPINQGKAEAVRQGLRHALATRPRYVGYLDADLATPIDEMCRLSDLLGGRDVDVVLGTRLSMLGRHIERDHVRHYLGRVFASAASLTLRLRVYDTQCGAKVFRATPALEAALDAPFLSRWAFDVELLGRLLAGGPKVPAVPVERIVEEPLLTWRDVPGSKLSLAAMAGAPVDLVRIALDLGNRRAGKR